MTCREYSRRAINIAASAIEVTQTVLQLCFHGVAPFLSSTRSLSELRLHNGMEGRSHFEAASLVSKTLLEIPAKVRGVWNRLASRHGYEARPACIPSRYRGGVVRAARKSLVF